MCHVVWRKSGFRVNAGLTVDMSTPGWQFLILLSVLARAKESNGQRLMMNDGKQQATFLFHDYAHPLRTAMNKGFMICDFSLVRNLVHNATFTSAGSHQTHHNAHR